MIRLKRKRKKNVNRIVLHLSTNDISKYKTDANQVISEITTAEKNYKVSLRRDNLLKYPTQVWETPITETLNNTAKMVNEFFMKMSKKESYMYFLNNDEDLLKDGVPIKSLYDPNDSNGIHLSVKGASVLKENI